MKKLGFGHQQSPGPEILITHQVKNIAISAQIRSGKALDAPGSFVRSWAEGWLGAHLQKGLHVSEFAMRHPVVSVRKRDIYSA